MESENMEYNNIIDTLFNTFGEVLSRDVMYNIVEAFGGDLEQSANAVMNIIMGETNDNITQPDSSVDMFRQTTEETTKPNFSTSSSDKPMTFSKVAATSNATTKVMSPVYQPVTSSSPDISQNFWTDQIQLILSNHENGARILILMRGLPGSGKTYLAKKIVDAIYYTTNQHYATHILSTDDYFMRNGQYVYDVTKLSEAHEWNKNRAKIAMTEGVSPVIIDNTNVEVWEMQFYVAQGVQNGYIIEVVEPNTPWARKVYQLSKRNSHNVPAATIRRKLDNYQDGVTGDYLMSTFRLRYSDYYNPPILRAIPPVSLEFSEESATSSNHIGNAVEINTVTSTKGIQENGLENQCTFTQSTTVASTSENISEECDKSSNLSNNTDRFAEMYKCLEEIEKVEKEWENGETWDDNSQIKSKELQDRVSLNSKPQRRNKFTEVKEENEKFISTDVVLQDWSSYLLPPWEENGSNEERKKEIECEPAVETKTSSTCIEYGDINMSSSENPLKIVTATPRNINEYHVEVNNRKMPKKWLIDRSTSTINDDMLVDTFDCPNKEKHFLVFRKLFKNIAKSDLRDIFDNCLGDVNWAVNIVLQGRINNEFDTTDDNDCSDSEVEEQNDNVDLCQCLAAYDVIPYHNESLPPPVMNFKKNINDTTPSTSKSKGKKETTVSESSLQLKRQIEQNVIISDNHYSEHCLKLRKLRRGEVTTGEEVPPQQIETADEHSNTETLHTTDNVEASTSQNFINTPNDNKPSTSTSEDTATDAEDSSVASEEVEKTVNITLGKEFIAQLDEIFGNRNMVYPSFITTTITVSIQLLNEIRALWLESFTHQLEEDAAQVRLMIQQDEEFARQLAAKEEELANAGKEPEVPDFKEIMDMDYALSLYQKDVAEWRKNMPDDLAAKLTRDKLYNIFPDMSKDVLQEVLVAHDNNFRETVEGLLVSTGQAQVLETKNGVGKFIMEKEMERRQKLLEEERKAIQEVEWPLLPRVENLNMSVVKEYRDEAERHLQARNMHFNKAQEYIRRGMTPVATYMNEVAAHHKRMYELANSKAAATLIQIHAAESSDNAIIDLHYLKVCEARETLDLFLDSHIRQLRDSQNRHRVRSVGLYFITGRGLHSNGGPRIKPAVKRRLEERGLHSSEKNPGLLTARVSVDSRLTHEIA